MASLPAPAELRRTRNLEHREFMTGAHHSHPRMLSSHVPSAKHATCFAYVCAMPCLEAVAPDLCSVLHNCYI